MNNRYSKVLGYSQALGDVRFGKWHIEMILGSGLLREESSISGAPPFSRKFVLVHCFFERIETDVVFAMYLFHHLALNLL